MLKKWNFSLFSLEVGILGSEEAGIAGKRRGWQLGWLGWAWRQLL
jgi:hypothetical protein